ncbi:hypothetical protein DM02DRAFT_542971 [Periconia macrospinosa]|uniref:ATPase AAA-type core domain-containing protein n=1 Tax=Periconia macrospinosa TaxID=97972 RepID=A0A2V1D3Y1_9PLEO|nr:hypothetical protein DM02DRAFT_542971 [Periconia macrospinosa]
MSLSTVLNILDGLVSPEGRALIITANYIKRVDPALIRFGRVDTKVGFRHADEVMISQLFLFSKNSICQIREEKDCELPQLAEEFMAKVPKMECSPAKVMSLLLANTQSPHNTIASVDTRVERIREKREKCTRTNSCSEARTVFGSI